MRYNFIYNTVLNVYKCMDKISFPLNIKELIENPKCKIRSYSNFADKNNIEYTSYDEYKIEYERIYDADELTQEEYEEFEENMQRDYY